MISWRPASEDDLSLVLRAMPDPRPEPVRELLRHWAVRVNTQDGAVAVAAILPPTAGHGRVYGAWWLQPGGRAEDAARDCVRQLVDMAATRGRELQVSLSESRVADARALQESGFADAFPFWTMSRDLDQVDDPGDDPDSVRLCKWDATALPAFLDAYHRAYRDQRVMEPHNAHTWAQLIARNDFRAEIAVLARTADGQVVSFVLGFGRVDATDVELGPVGTIPEWRSRGLSNLLLTHSLLACRDAGFQRVNLTVDGASPTGAQRLYFRNGFRVTERIIAWRLPLTDLPI